MFRPLSLTQILSLAGLLTARILFAQGSVDAPGLDDLANASALDVKGKPAYHLKMKFTLNDLRGHALESGTIERWWWAPGHERTSIASTSYNASFPGDTQVKASREAYLVRLIRQQVTNPFEAFSSQHDMETDRKKRTVVGVDLNCVVPTRRDIGTETAPHALGPEFCTRTASNIIVMMFDQGEFSSTRKRFSKFGETTYPKDVELFYAGFSAIVGQVLSLETYTPTTSELEAASKPSEVAVLPRVTVEDSLQKKVPPSYPEFARHNHIEGSVTLCVILSKEGTVSSVDVVASPDQSLTDSAINGVNQWIYRPYLVDGVPVQVDTRITVNYALNKH